jgi:hypothetical protein
MKIRNGQSEFVMEFSRILDTVASIESSRVGKLLKIGFRKSGTNLKTYLPEPS